MEGRESNLKTEESIEKDDIRKTETIIEETKKDEMRAVVLSGFGGLKTLKILKKYIPDVTENEVLIKIRYCGLNFQDLMIRQGAIDSLPKTPFIMGLECVGEIISVGASVTNFQIGDRVFAFTECKGWAEYVACNIMYVYKLPDEMTYEIAIGITLAYVVAYILLFELGCLSSGKIVLFHSAGGAVGQAIAYLCSTISDVVTIGIASNCKHDNIRNSVTLLLDREDNYVKEIKKQYPLGVDIVLDCLCGEDFNRGYNLLKPMGKYILYGTSNFVSGETKSIFTVAKAWWHVDKVSPFKLLDENRTISGFSLRHVLFHQHQEDYVRQIVGKIFKLWESSNVTLKIDSIWALEDVAEAMQKMHDHKNIGKLLLDPLLSPAAQVKEVKDETKKIENEESNQEN